MNDYELNYETENSGNKNGNGKRKGDIACEVCKKRFRSSYYLRLHMKVHTGEKNYICGICKKSYQQKWNLITHMGRIHSKEKPFECWDCGRAFGYSSHFKRHIKVHFLDKIDAPPAIKGMILNPHACELCYKSFESKYRLNLHVKTHRRNQHYFCDKCGQNFKSEKLRQRHFEKVHNPQMELSSLHSYLQKESKSNRMPIKNENEVVKRLPAVETRKMSCEVCGKMMTILSMKKHLNIHFQSRIFRCRYCEKEFPESGQRTTHERKHTGERPYSCDVCGMKCSQYSNLLTHRKRYHNLVTKMPKLWKQSFQNKRKRKALTKNLIITNSTEIISGENMKLGQKKINVFVGNEHASTTPNTSSWTGNETIEQFYKITSQWTKKLKN